MRSIVWMAVLGALAAPTALAAQDPGTLVFVGGLSYRTGGPGPSLVESLDAADLGDEKPERCYLTTCVEAVEHPFHLDAGLDVALFLGARYRAHAPLSVEALISNGPRGHAEGYNHSTKDQLIVGYSSFNMSVTGGLHLGPVRVAAGPTMSQTVWRVTASRRKIRKSGTWDLGWAAEVSVAQRLGDTAVAIRAGVQAFGRTDLRDEFLVPIDSEYRSFHAGVTVSPAAGLGRHE